MMEEHLLQCVGESLEQMETIRYLDGIRCSTSCRFGIAAPPIPADNLRCPMLGEPGHQRVGGAIRQEVDHAMPFQVHHHGAVPMPSAEGPIIHSQHSWDRMVLLCCSTDQ